MRKFRKYVARFHVGDEPTQEIEFVSWWRANSMHNIADAREELQKRKLSEVWQNAIIEETYLVKD